MHNFLDGHQLHPFDLGHNLVAPQGGAAADALFYLYGLISGIQLEQSFHHRLTAAAGG
ncbi:hypothetical protein D3C76_1691010 [compost metagenome]